MYSIEFRWTARNGSPDRRLFAVRIEAVVGQFVGVCLYGIL
jgi:hypothetical protein